MRPIRTQLMQCFIANEKSFGFNFDKDFKDKTVEIEYDGTYPTSEELIYFQIDKDHTINIKGTDYKHATLPTEIFHDTTLRTHKIKLFTLHLLCMRSLLNYIDAVNQIEDETPTINKYLNDFEYYYTTLRQCSDNTIKINYRRYWREILINIASAIAENKNEFSATLNLKAKRILHISLTTTYNRLTAVA